MKTNQGETIFEAIKPHFPEVTHRQAENLLWHCTAFPMVNEEALKEQIREIADKSDGEYGAAMRIAEEEVAKALNALK